jgi:hypothetical protein
MWALTIAAACAGLFAGAAIYINAVEHPARLACGNELALKEFGPQLSTGHDDAGDARHRVLLTIRPPSNRHRHTESRR